jgi:hypothetical protein
VSHHPVHPPVTPIRVRFGRLSATWVLIAVLAGIALIGGGLSLLIDDDGTASGVTPVSTESVGGPNEAARGAAAARASGGAVHALTLGAVRSGGPDESARGQAASRAATRPR